MKNLRSVLPAGPVWLLLVVSAVSQAQTTQPDLVLQGVVTRADYQTYKEVPFVVPPGVIRVSVEFSYTTRDQRTTIDLGLLDPSRFRGWSGGNKSYFSVSETDATPSYLAGPIPPGEWHLLLGIPNIRENVHGEFTAKVYFLRRGQRPEVSTFERSPVSAKAAWYRGDLHMHTAHSDGSCKNQSGESVPCPLFKTVEAAVNRGLDFIAITDHNTISHYDAMRELQPYFDRLLLIPGREVTTFQGHANVFGAVEFIDFRLGGQHVPNAAALLQQIQDLHSLISINHPMAPSGENCMGCGWTAPSTNFAHIQAVEAVNGGISKGKFAGIPFWESQLNRGFRLTGIGGSDNHNADRALDKPGSIGYPTTVVYADALSEKNILNGIRAGHVFVDLQGSKDRSLNMSAKAGQATAAMGDSLTAPAGTAIAISIHVTHVPSSRVEVIEDGHPQNLASPDVQGDDDLKTFPFTSDGAKHWIRVNVVSPQGDILLLGNPVYLNFQPPFATPAH